jgi:predicted dehydrogenase
VCLAGVGRWGEKHLRVLAELGVDVWVAEPEEARRRRALAAGVPPGQVVADVEAALASVDALDIVTPADSHLALAEAALSAGRDCFVEKPVTRTAAEAERLRELARASGRIVQVGHVFRFHPVTDALADLLAQGVAGTVRYATGRFAGFKRPRADAGVTQSDAVHYIDLFAHLLARRPTAVTATLRDLLGRGLDDLCFATVEYGEVPVFIEAGYFVPGTHRDCVIVGTDATLVGDFGAAEVRVVANRHVAGPGGWQAREGDARTVAAGGPEPLRRELQAFVEAVKGRTAPAVDVDAGLEALRVVEAAQESARSGRRVEIRG